MQASGDALKQLLIGIPRGRENPLLVGAETADQAVAGDQRAERARVHVRPRHARRAPGLAGGVAGLLLIPLLIVLAAPPFAATLVGYATESLILEYATLAAIALILIGIYFFVINAQGRALERREIQILEAIKEPDQ